MEANRPLIGILLGGIDDSFSSRVCKGIIRAAKEKKVDIVILPGKYIHRDLSGDYQFRYEYQYNTLFSLAMNHSVDGVIIASGSIGCYTTKERLDEFLKRYSALPCVVVGDKNDFFPSVSYDNEDGIREGLTCLIEKLHCKEIVMMEGPEDNIDSRERKATFISELQRHGVSVGEDNCIKFDINRKQKDVFTEYIKKHQNVDAVFCVNDETALSVYEALKENGKIPGKDIYVMGYDNTIQGEKAKPSLSSVKADPGLLGETALEMVLRQCMGDDVESVRLHTQFLERESFGYQEKPIFQQQLSRLKYDQIDNYYKDIFYRYIESEKQEKIYQMFKNIQRMICDYYENGMEESGEREVLGAEVSKFLRMGAIQYADTMKLLEHVEQIHLLFHEKYEGTKYDAIVFQAFARIYREIVLAEEQLQGDMILAAEHKNFSITSFVIGSMQFEHGSDQSYGALLDYLEWLDIQDAALFLFVKPQTNLPGEEFMLPNHIYKKARLKEGKVKTIRTAKSRSRTRELLSNINFTEQSSVKIVLPIFTNEFLYGFFVSDMTEKLYEYGEFLAGQLGSAAKMLQLLKQNEHIQNEYEKSLATLKENNIALDTLAKSDGLTGILNRRGFMESAQTLLNANIHQKKATLVAFIDMNNLKIVNDRYGHEEGDFSILLISQKLQELFKDGIVGRIGGDEFALISDFLNEENEKDIVSKIYQAFTDFNEGSDKAYNVTVSVGICVVNGEEITLDDALGIADEKLYVEKQNRSKNVAKSI